MIDKIAEYFENIENFPVMSQASPGDIFNNLPNTAPSSGVDFEEIIKDFDNIIMPGITHWQSPNFHAYFPANNSYPSILGELLTSALGLQCMIWQTSPSAAELEEKVMIWLAGMIGLPKEFVGTIQDTASTATLCSLLTAREFYSHGEVNSDGLFNKKVYRIYCSTEAHSSIEKAVKIMGIGKKNLIKIPVDSNFSMIPSALEDAIVNDLRKGYKPLAVVAALGTTGTTSVDPIKEIGQICSKRKIWFHIDAAFAGTALILPEMKHYLEGIEYADTFVFNPHKWMMTNFDCSAYFVKDKETLVKTFEIMPEYLKTQVDNHVNNYRDWGIQLGRRFRALKLWFVLRSYGVEGLQSIIRNHITIAKNLENLIKSEKDFEILAPVLFNTICFRYNPYFEENDEKINKINELLLDRLNKSGKIYLSHTKLNGKYTLRFVVAQTNVTEKHVLNNWNFIKEIAKEILSELNSI
jgi:aromatic-L-amino-acid decarboxylase